MFAQLFILLYSLVLKRGGNCMIDSSAPGLGRPAVQTPATNDITSTRWQNGASKISWHKQGIFVRFSNIAKRAFFATFLDCWYSRMQDCRSSSRRKPRRQKHWKEPALFWHVWSQPPLAARHSSTSKQTQTQNRLKHFGNPSDTLAKRLSQHVLDRDKPSGVDVLTSSETLPNEIQRNIQS